jgi:Phage-related minor tail protein
MGDINEIVSVEVTGTSELNALADAAGRVDEAFASMQRSIAGMDLSAAGPDKLVTAWDSAASKISASIDKIAGSAARLGDLGAAGGAGPDKLVAAWDDAAAQISGDIDKIAGAAGKLDDIGAGAGTSGAEVGKLGDALGETAAGADKLAGASAPAADGVKGIGTSADESAAQLAALRAEMAETAAASDELMAAIAAGSKATAGDIAAAQRLNTAAAKSAADDAIATQAAQADAAKQAAAQAEASAGKYHTLALGGAAALGYGIYEAAKLQTQVTRLYTSAGESQANLPMIQQGILGMAGPTATDQSQLAQGAYWVESAGFHGQSALNVLRSVAQGAYAEGAPLQDVANAATSILTSYGMYNPTQQQSNAVINQMLTAVGQGKMTMGGLSSALPAVLPVAASAGISLPQVLGSLATMTATGMSPEWASQNLGHAIAKFQNPTATMTAEMYQLGLDPVQISRNLSKAGISGTEQEIQAAIQAHQIKSGPDKGMIQLPAMNMSKAAAQDALTMIKEMPPAIQKVAQAYYDGKISAQAWNQEMFKGSESAQAKAMLQQFATVTNLAHGYNSALKAGQPAVQAYNAAVAKTLGDSASMRTYLELTGQHSQVTAQSIEKVSQAARDAGQNVQGWSDIQKTAGYQLKSFETSAKATATTMGAALLPEVTGVMDALAHVGGFLASNPGLTKALGVGGGILGASYLAQKVASPVMTAVQGVGKVAQVLHIPGLDKLANVGQNTGLAGAAGNLDGAAAALKGAAADLSEAAGKESVAAEEGAPGKSGTPGASGLGGALGPVQLGLAIGLALRAAGDTIAPKGTPAGQYSQAFQQSAARGPNPASQLHPYILGGFEGWLTQHIGLPVGGVESSVANTIASWFGHSSAPKSQPISLGNTIPSGLYGPPLPAAPGTPGMAYAANTLKAGSQVKIPAPDTSALAQAKSKVQQDLNAINQALAEVKAHPGKIPAPDVSALETAKAKVTADLNTIKQDLATASGKAVHIPAPDLSALTAAAGKAGQAAQQITTAMQTALSKQVRAAPPDLAAYGQAVGTARGDGVAISAGLASGIMAGEGQAVAAAHQVAQAVEAALNVSLQVHSPSKVTYKTGQEFTTGLAHGITSKKATAQAAAVNLSASTVTSLTQGLQGGQSAIDTALQAISGKGSRPQDITNIVNTISTLKGDVAQALKAGQITKPEDSALVKMLNADNMKLQALAAKRTMLETEITDAQQIAQQVISGASIMNAGSYTPALAASGGPVAASQTIQGMQYQAGDYTAFAQQVRQLQKQGLNSAMLDQIIQSGPSQGLPLAEGLTQGGPAAIKQLNDLEKQIHAAASSIGNTGGPAMYQAGVQAAQGIASGLKSQLGAVDSAMSQIAKSMMATLQHDLGKAAASKAPTSAASSAASAAAGGTPGTGATSVLSIPSLGHLAQMGNSAASALARDVTAGNMAAAALDRLAGAANRAAQAHGGNHHGGGTGGGAPPVVHVTVNVTVMGSLVSQSDLADHIQGVLLAKNSNNWNAGIVYPGRAL